MNIGGIGLNRKCYLAMMLKLKFEDVRKIGRIVRDFNNLDTISTLHAHLYDDPSVQNLNLSEIAEYLEEKNLFSAVETRGPFLKNYGKPLENTAGELAKTRVWDLETLESDFEPSDEEVEFEKDLIQNPEMGMTSALYDGFRLRKVFSTLLPEGEEDISHVHVIFTNRFFCTWKPATQRYHARVCVHGFPTIISTTGIVDAPARPKGFYQLEWRDGGGPTVKSFEEEFEGEFVDYDDKRLTEIMKGYTMQAVFYHFTANPFCDNNKCRLYNPHLQKNILNAQLTSPEFCANHQKLLEEFKEKLH